MSLYPTFSRRPKSRLAPALALLLSLGGLPYTKWALANTTSDQDALANQASLASVATRVTASELSQAISGHLMGLGGSFRIRLGQSSPIPQTGWLLASNAATPLPREETFDWSAVSLWATPVISGVENRIKPLTSEGTVKVLILGAEYAFSDQARVAGLAISKDWLDIDTTYNQGKVTGTGLTFSPYLAWQLNTEWTLDASLGVGSSSTTAKTPSLRSEPDLDRRFLSLGLTHARALGKWYLLSKASLTGSEDEVKAFVSSNGQTSAASTTRLNQLKLGVYAIYNRPTVSPFVAVYHLANDFSVSGASGVKPVEYSNTQQLQLGLNASSGPLYGALAYQAERGRSQWRLYGGIRY